MMRFRPNITGTFLLMSAAAACLFCCARMAFLDDNALENTLALLDHPQTTRGTLTQRFGPAGKHGESWARYEKGSVLPVAVRRKTLVVLFDDAGRVADYRYTAVTGCAMPRALGKLPDEDRLSEACRPGKTKAEILSHLGPPLAAGPKMLAYLSRTGKTFRGRIITFDEKGRFLRLTRTALNITGDNSVAGADLNDEALSKLRKGMRPHEVAALLGTPQMAAGDVWGYCATSPGHKKLLAVKFHPRRGLSDKKIREAFDARAGRTSACYVCHRLSFAPTCLDCHGFDPTSR